jgi:hypothetical protein
MFFCCELKKEENGEECLKTPTQLSVGAQLSKDEHLCIVAGDTIICCSDSVMETVSHSVIKAANEMYLMIIVLSPRNILKPNGRRRYNSF